MTSPFDPRSWLPRKPGQDDVASWLDLWLDATTWWVEPATRAVEPAARIGTQMITGQPPERILAELVDGVARRFSGNRIDIQIHGRPTEGRLDSLRVFRKEDRFEARVDLSEASFDGVPVEEVAVVVRSLVIEQTRPARPAKLTAEMIEIAGRAHLRPLVTWLDQYLDDWELAVGDDHAFVATPSEPRYRQLSFTVDPSLRDHVLRLDLRGARWGRLRLGVPRWLRFTKTVDLPRLPGDLHLDEGTAVGDRVEFRLTVPSASGTIDLAALRDAVIRGTRIIIG